MSRPKMPPRVEQILGPELAGFLRDSTAAMRVRATTTGGLVGELCAMPSGWTSSPIGPFERETTIGQLAVRVLSGDPAWSTLTLEIDDARVVVPLMFVKPRSDGILLVRMPTPARVRIGETVVVQLRQGKGQTLPLRALVAWVGAEVWT